VGELVSELAFRASSVSAQGTVVSSTRLLNPVFRVTPDAGPTVQRLSRKCKLDKMMLDRDRLRVNSGSHPKNCAWLTLPEYANLCHSSTDVDECENAIELPFK
jgi:hypothetical protein